MCVPLAIWGKTPDPVDAFLIVTCIVSLIVPTAVPKLQERKAASGKRWSEVWDRLGASLEAGVRYVAPPGKSVERTIEVFGKVVQENLAHAKPTSELRVLAASGYDLIGLTPSHGIMPGLLHDDIKAWAEQGGVKVLLMHPLADPATERANALGIDLPQYRTSIIRLAIRLRQSSERIDVRFYKEAPIWQGVFTSPRIVLIPEVALDSKRQRFSSAPLAVIESKGRAKAAGLHRGLRSVWRRRWATSLALNQLHLHGVDLQLTPDEVGWLEREYGPLSGWHFDIDIRDGDGDAGMSKGHEKATPPQTNP